MTVTLELNEQTETELRAWATRNKRGLQSESDVRAALENLVAAALYEDARDWEESLEAIDRGFQAAREGRTITLDAWRAKMTLNYGVQFTSAVPESEDVEVHLTK